MSYYILRILLTLVVVHKINIFRESLCSSWYFDYCDRDVCTVGLDPDQYGRVMLPDLFTFHNLKYIAKMGVTLNNCRR